MANATGIGAALRRKEDLRFLTGRGNYVADIKRPDMAFGAFLRSPHAHAAIKSHRRGAALALPGVVAVLHRRGSAGRRRRRPALRAGRSSGKGGTPTKEPRIRRWRKARCATSATPSLL